jgi:hypothetical protein
MKQFDPSELIAAERGRPEPPDELKAQARARLAALLGPSAGLGAASGDVPLATSDAGAASAVAGSGAVKLVAAFIAGGALGGGSVYAIMDARPPPALPAPSVTVVARPAETASPTASAPLAPNLSARASAEPALPSAHRPPPPTTQPKTGDAQLAQERALMERARSALARGDSSEALRATGQHAKSFPRGRLSEEREALAIQALAAAGRRSEAEQRAASFERYYPNSVLGPAVKRALGR